MSKITKKTKQKRIEHIPVVDTVSGKLAGFVQVETPPRKERIVKVRVLDTPSKKIMGFAQVLDAPRTPKTQHVTVTLKNGCWKIS